MGKVASHPALLIYKDVPYLLLLTQLCDYPTRYPQASVYFSSWEAWTGMEVHLFLFYTEERHKEG